MGRGICTSSSTPAPVCRAPSLDGGKDGHVSYRVRHARTRHSRWHSIRTPRRRDPELLSLPQWRHVILLTKPRRTSASLTSTCSRNTAWSTPTPTPSTAAQSPLHHLAQHPHHLRRVFKTLIIHTFLRVVDVCDGSFGQTSRLLPLVQAIVEVRDVFELDGETNGMTAWKEAFGKVGSGNEARGRGWNVVERGKDEIA